MNPPRWTAHVAAAIIVAVVVICYFAFPNVQTKTVTNRVVVDPYAKYLPLEEESYPLTADGLVSYCQVSESRKDVRDNPQDGDVIIQVCRASRAAPVG